MSRTLRVMLVAMTGLTLRLEGVYLMRRAALDGLQLVAARSAGSIGFEIAAKLHARKRPKKPSQAITHRARAIVDFVALRGGSIEDEKRSVAPFASGATKED